MAGMRAEQEKIKPKQGRNLARETPHPSSCRRHGEGNWAPWGLGIPSPQFHHLWPLSFWLYSVPAALPGRWSRHAMVLAILVSCSLHHGFIFVASHTGLLGRLYRDSAPALCGRASVAIRNVGTSLQGPLHCKESLQAILSSGFFKKAFTYSVWSLCGGLFPSSAFPATLGGTGAS